jgi:protein-S-isoprenylcysteine O-methyltransferase Ste14
MKREAGMKRGKIIEFATYVVVFLAMAVISPILAKWLDSLYLPPSSVLADSPVLLVIGACIALPGMGLVMWTIFLFRTLGRGTPNPKLPPKELVTSGPYQYTRNPMALGGFYFLLGEAAIYASPSLLGISILFAIILYCNAVWIEEPELQRRFGAPYSEYLRRVPRFLPNPFRRKRYW